MPPVSGVMFLPLDQHVKPYHWHSSVAKFLDVQSGTLPHVQLTTPLLLIMPVKILGILRNGTDVL